MITQRRLKDVIHYDPETGVFTWLVDINPRALKGAEAGYVLKGYRVITLDGKKMQAHRLAFLYMTGAFPTDIADHINRNQLDNRWSNIRESDKSRNAINTKLYANNTSGFRGVNWHGLHKRWVAKLAVNGKRKFLGEHKTKEAAAMAYDVAALAAFGSVAQLNFPAAAG